MVLAVKHSVFLFDLSLQRKNIKDFGGACIHTTNAVFSHNLLLFSEHTVVGLEFLPGSDVFVVILSSGDVYTCSPSHNSWNKQVSRNLHTGLIIIRDGRAYI